MTLKEITLLSIEEYKQFQSIVSLVECWRWWLRSPGRNQNNAACAYGGGVVCGYSDYVHKDNGCVRPALKLNLEISDTLFWYKPEKLIGTKIEYGNYRWTVLDTSLGELYVLCDSIIARRRFDPESNNWATSELKQWLETEGLKLITI